MTAAPKPSCRRSRNSYNQGCHCPACTAANTRYKVERRRAEREVAGVPEVRLDGVRYMPPPKWRMRPACADSPLEFREERPRELAQRAVWEAERAAVCRRCPVFVQCAAYARELRPTIGFWAGQAWKGDVLGKPLGRAA